MIEEVKIRNYGCLRDVKVRLEPLTALVGPNASGKSTCLDALNLSSQGVSEGVERPWRKDSKIDIEVKALLTSGETLMWGWVSGRVKKIRPRELSYQKLHLDLKTMSTMRQVQVAEKLALDGSNMANVFSTLTRVQQQEVAGYLGQMVPEIADVDVRPVAQSGHHALRFQDGWDKGLWYDAADVSDGTLLLLAFLLIQFQSNAVELLAIEEPERSLHPYLLGELVAYLRKISQGELGPRKVQVVLATHSAELLEFLKPEEVRFFSRDTSDGSVVITEAPVDGPAWGKAFEEYKNSLSSAWLSGGLGGVPGSVL